MLLDGVLWSIAALYFRCLTAYLVVTRREHAIVIWSLHCEKCFILLMGGSVFLPCYCSVAIDNHVEKQNLCALAALDFMPELNRRVASSGSIIASQYNFIPHELLNVSNLYVQFLCARGNDTNAQGEKFVQQGEARTLKRSVGVFSV